MQENCHLTINVRTIVDIGNTNICFCLFMNKKVFHVKYIKCSKNLKQKNFSEVRKWVVSNLDNDPSVLLRKIYDNLYDAMVPTSIPAAVLVIAKYQYQIAFVADQEINLLAALTEIMVECEFK